MARVGRDESLYPGHFDRLTCNKKGRKTVIYILGDGVVGISQAAAWVEAGFDVCVIANRRRLRSSAAALGQAPVRLSSNDVPEGFDPESIRRNALEHFTHLSKQDEYVVSPRPSLEENAPAYLKNSPGVKQYGAFSLDPDTYSLEVDEYLRSMRNRICSSGAVTYVEAELRREGNNIFADNFLLGGKDEIIVDCTNGGLSQTPTEQSLSDDYVAGLSIFISSSGFYNDTHKQLDYIICSNGTFYLAICEKLDGFLISSARPSAMKSYTHADLGQDILNLLASADEAYPDESFKNHLMQFQLSNFLTDHELISDSSERNTKNTTRNGLRRWAYQIAGLRHNIRPKFLPWKTENGSKVYKAPAVGGNGFTLGPGLAPELVKIIGQEHNLLNVDMSATVVAEQSEFPSLRSLFPETARTVSDMRYEVQGASPGAFLLALSMAARGYDTTLSYTSVLNSLDGELLFKIDPTTLVSHVDSLFTDTNAEQVDAEKVNAEKIAAESVRLLEVFSKFPESGITKNHAHYEIDHAKMTRYLLKFAKKEVALAANIATRNDKDINEIIEQPEYFFCVREIDSSVLKTEEPVVDVEDLANNSVHSGSGFWRPTRKLEFDSDPKSTAIITVGKDTCTLECGQGRFSLSVTPSERKAVIPAIPYLPGLATTLVENRLNTSPSPQTVLGLGKASRPYRSLFPTSAMGESQLVRKQDDINPILP